MSGRDDAEADATAFMTREIAEKAEPHVLRALSKDVAASAGLSSKERRELESGRVSSETAAKLSANAARDLENRRRR